MAAESGDPLLGDVPSLADRVGVVGRETMRLPVL